jgi:gliding motility-associated-like protein
VSSGSQSEVEVTLVVFDDSNCSDTLTTLISLEDALNQELRIPNVLTPNQDGQNDRWCLSGASRFEGCFSVSIQNRWGSEVFAAQSTQSCWDGGQAPDGVYFYTIQAADQNISGTIHLTR